MEISNFKASGRTTRETHGDYYIHRIDFNKVAAHICLFDCDKYLTQV